MAGGQRHADAAQVISQVFDEAERRDPCQHRTWVALVDGNNHQLARVHAEAQARGVQVTIVVDFVHVLEYLWRAAWCCFAEGDSHAETWVHDHARSVLAGRASVVAAAIRRNATRNHLDAAKRKPADTAAAYLLNKKAYLDYPTALARGWPIATGVIEGSARCTVTASSQRTGRSTSQERQRVHAARYANGIIPHR